MCELLLEAEADVDQTDSGGRTPILAAASMGHSHIVELLLFWGCYVDSIDAEGRTVLSVAAAQVIFHYYIPNMNNGSSLAFYNRDLLPPTKLNLLYEFSGKRGGCAEAAGSRPG